MARGRYVGFLLRYLELLLFKRRTLGRTVEDMAARRGQAPCCLFESERISYETFNRRANQRAHVLHTMGVSKGEVVCLLMENRPEYLESVVALSKLGAVAALINHNLKDTPLAHSLNVSGARRVIVGRECLAALQEVVPGLERIEPAGVLVDTRWPDDQPLPEGAGNLNEMMRVADEGNPPRVPLTSQDGVLYIYTSGTTGLPKAARVTHYRWYGAGLAFGYYALQVSPEDVVYCPLPLYHSNGILIAFGAALANGAALALTRRFSASRFWDEVEAYGATCFIYIGELLRYVLNRPPAPNETTHRLSRILGNGLRPDIWSAFQERFRIPHIREFYASTEGNTYLINLDDVPGSVGTPVLKFADNLALVRYDVEAGDYIRDERGFCVPCPPGEAGELLGKIKFTTPFHGYATRADTERKLLRDVFKRGDAYFRTGDLLRRDERGYYYFVDRIGDTYRWKGENVATQEVQEVLSGFPGVHLVSVYGVHVPGHEGRVGMAAVMMEPGHAFDGAALYRYASERLATFAMPAFVRLVDEMDVTGTFKLRKTELQREGYNPHEVEQPLFELDRREGAYVPLDRDRYQRIVSGGELRL